MKSMKWEGIGMKNLFPHTSKFDLLSLTFRGSCARVYVNSEAVSGYHYSSNVLLTARIVCRAGSMQLSGVRPSVCLSHPAAARRCCGFAAVGTTVRRYRSIAARPAVSSSRAAARRAAANASVSRCRLT